jgi:GPH family glycoside/pentoside/hexuronide:cation symporter
MLTQIGYVPNIAQSDATLQGLRQLIFIWPCALAIIAALTMGFFYTLNEKRFALIIEEINQRKNKEMDRRKNGFRNVINVNSRYFHPGGWRPPYV